MNAAVGPPLHAWRSRALPTAVITALICAAYYVGGMISIVLQFEPRAIADIWLPHGIVVAALLTTPVRRWWLHGVALLPTHLHLMSSFQGAVPLTITLIQFGGNILPAVLSAAVLRPVLGHPPRLDSPVRMAVLIATALLVGGLVSAATAWLFVATDWVADFALAWQHHTLAQACSVVIVAPVLHLATGGLTAIARAPRQRLAEFAVLTAALLAVLPASLGWESARSQHLWLLFAPLPLLLVSAVRFGPTGLGLHLLVIHLGAVLNTKAGLGPFVAGPATEVVPSLQGFALTISIPLLLLAALVQQHARTIANLRQSQARYRSVVEDDISERKRAEQAARDSEAQLRLFVQHSPAAVAMFDRDVRYLVYSDRWLTDYKLGDQDLTGRSHYDVFPEAPEHWKEIHRRCLGGAFETCDEESFTRVDGSQDWIRWEVRPWHEASGRIGGIIMFTEVITERKRAAEEHRQLVAQKHVAEALMEVDRRKDEFLDMLAHELRNPLMPMMFAVDLMQTSATADESVVLARDIVARQTRRLTRLVDDLLDVSRITRGKVTLDLSSFDLGDIVAEAVETAQALLSSRDQQLTIDVPDGPLPIRGDRARVIQMLSNLLDNAAKSTGDNGRIALHIHRDGGQVTVKVKDNGSGIAPDMIARVFDMFMQLDTPGGGPGLGIELALVKQLAEMHGGSIEARSDGLGHGSEFVLRLPLDAAQQVEPPVLAPASIGNVRDLQPRVPRRRILIVDDNRDAADALARVLRLQEHEVVVAHDGLAGLQRAQQLGPDIVFLDIGMPELDGLEVARRLRLTEDGSRALLVAMTGFGQAEDRARTAAAGFDQHLTKPIDPQTVYSLVRAAVPRPARDAAE